MKPTNVPKDLRGRQAQWQNNEQAREVAETERQAAEERRLIAEETRAGGEVIRSAGEDRR